MLRSLLARRNNSKSYFSRPLMAPTVGVLFWHGSSVALSAKEQDFILGILHDALEQTNAVAGQLEVDGQPGRLIFVGKHDDEPNWIRAAREHGWTTFSVSPSQGAQESDLTYDVRIDAKELVACNAEILVILRIDKLPSDSHLLGNLLPEALLVTHTVSSVHYWCFENIDLRQQTHAYFCLAIQHIISGTEIQPTGPEVDDIVYAQHGFSLGGIFPAMVRLLSGKVHRVTFRYKEFSEVQKETPGFRGQKYLRSRTVDSLEEARSRVINDFVQADETALYHGDQYRSTILLGLFFTLIAFLALIVSHFNNSWSFVLRLTELGSLCAILVMAIAERSFDMHRKWLVHRMIAELLRPIQYLLALWLRTSRGFNFPERPQHLSSAIAYQRSVIREASPLALHIDQDYLDDMRTVLLDLLANQIMWHRLNADTYLRCQKWFVWANKVFFGLLLLAGLLSLTFSAGSFWANLCFVLASVCTLSISISAACIHYFSFSHIAERSEVALRRYQTLRDHVATLGPGIAYSDIKLWMQSTTDVMADEQLDWFRQTSRLRVFF